MKSFTAKKINNKLVVELPPSPSSSYTIFFYFISVILLSLICYVLLYFHPNFVKAFAISFVPIALLIFNFKINVWNTFGNETIEIDKIKVSSTLDYKFIYKKRTTEYIIGGGVFYFISSKDGSKIEVNETVPVDHKKSKFKIILIDDGKKIYQSSNFLTYDELLDLKEKLVGSK
jgi:hypothetical protein